MHPARFLQRWFVLVVIVLFVLISLEKVPGTATANDAIETDAFDNEEDEVVVVTADGEIQSVDKKEEAVNASNAEQSTDAAEKNPSSTVNKEDTNGQKHSSAIPSIEKSTVKQDEKCPDREHIIRCAAAYLDTNKNRKLDRDELENAVKSLPWYARGILQILGSVDKMMKKCDTDGDDAISIDTDMTNNKETCLASCFKRRAFKSAFFSSCDL